MRGQKQTTHWRTIQQCLSNRVFTIKTQMFMRIFEYLKWTDRKQKEQFIIANKDKTIKELVLLYGKEL
jgi:hypothetical protein